MGEQRSAEQRSALEYRMDRLEDAVTMISESLQTFGEALRTLTKLEAHHAETRSGLERSFQAMRENRSEQKTVNDDFESRLRFIETEMPVLKIIRRWIMGGVVGMISIAGTLALMLLSR